MDKKGYDANRENPRRAAQGMYLAAAELCRHGFNVTPTSRNMAGADLLITDDRCQNTWTIQVKVTDQTIKKRRGWLIGRHATETANQTHAYVFVRLNSIRPHEFFIVPSTIVAQKQTGAASMPEFRVVDAETFRDQWIEILGDPKLISPAPQVPSA